MGVKGASPKLRIRRLVSVAGGDAFILKVVAHSVEELEGLVEKLLEHGVPTTSVVFSSPVVRRSLPLG